MPTPLLTTKLSIPPKRTDWVLRPRLLKRLDRGREGKLTLISAPAGFGKTTLIASWLHGLGGRRRTPPRVAWLSIEEDDNDPVRFLSHFIAALQTFDPGIGLSARSYLETPQVPKLDNLMTLVINDLASLTEPAILILDDYHVITQPDLQTALTFFLDHLPPKIHLIIATREEPLLHLPRLRARREVIEIRLQDLRFTREETARFLKRTMGLVLPAEAAQALEDQTEGWVAGLQMAALSLRGRATSSDPAHTAPVDVLGGGRRYIIDYLAAEVLKQQPLEIRTFLRQTAILDRFNAPLCDAVTSRCDSQAMLSHLERSNLFLIALDDRREWYRYHHLFAEFLRAEPDESEQNQLHARASRWYEDHGFTSEAIRHALAARDYSTAVRLIRRGVEEWCRNGGFNTLLGWINALPEGVVRAHSDLLVHKGWILYVRGELLTGEAYAALAMETERPDAPPLQRAMLLTFRAYLAITRGRPAQAVEFAQEALSLLGETESFYHASALTYLGHAQRLVGDRKAAIQTLRQAITLSQQLGNHTSSLEALCYLTLLLYQQGHLREAILLCEESANLYLDARGQSLPVGGMVQVPLGMLYYETNDLARAFDYLTTGIVLCHQVGLIYSIMLGQLTLAKLYAASGKVEAAWEMLAAARSTSLKSENQRHIRLVKAVTAELELRQGLATKAAATLAELPAEAGNRSEQENLVCARLLLAQGQAREACDSLDHLEQSARRQGRHGRLINIHLLQSLANLSLNNSTLAFECLERAICLAAPEGYRRAFLDEGPALAALLSEQQHLAPAFVAGLLEAFSNSSADVWRTPPTALPAQGLVEPLSETQLTILGLVADGLSNRDIAARLAITEGTTKWHLNQIYGKLHVNRRTQAVAQARHLKLL
jgi:LuxR family maltose regulon positive regulatory protein